jgi:hypothetical protein
VTDERPWVVKPYVDDRLDGMKAAYNSLPEVNDPNVCDIGTLYVSLILVHAV